MNILDNAKNHFDNLGTKKIEVPEWGDENGPAFIYAEPCTLADKGKIKKRSEKDEIDALAYILILKAQDAQGNKLFTLEDKHALKTKVDPDVLSRIASEMMRAPSIEQMLGE